MVAQILVMAVANGPLYRLIFVKYHAILTAEGKVEAVW